MRLHMCIWGEKLWKITKYKLEWGRRKKRGQFASMNYYYQFVTWVRLGPIWTQALPNTFLANSCLEVKGTIGISNFSIRIQLGIFFFLKYIFLLFRVFVLDIFCACSIFGDCVFCDIVNTETSETREPQKPQKPQKLQKLPGPGPGPIAQFFDHIFWCFLYGRVPFDVCSEPHIVIWMHPFLSQKYVGMAIGTYGPLFIDLDSL